MNIKNFIIFLLIVTFFKTVGSQDPSVQLHHGTTILGVQVFTESRVKVHAFLGVPYAQPPTGKFRFSPPHKWVDWNQTIIASRYAPSCPQLVDKNSMFEFNQDEDCLYLNIWVPQGRSYGDTLPTIVFLEGENFVSGSPSKYPAQDLAAYGHGVIVISISYRLNIFGFFCLEDSAARGNLGLLDQYFALLWVREHIQSFGGSKTSITLMGHSTGAASVVLHMTSSRTIGLFQRAIVMSGSATSPWSVGEHPANCSMAVSRSLNCLLQQTVDTLRCLQAKSAAEILAAFQKQCDGGLGRAALLPVVDTFLPLADQYLTRHPRDALHSGDYRPVPVLSGIVSLDGSLVLDEKDHLATQSFQELQRFFSESAVPAVVEKYGFINHIQVIQDILKWKYVEKAKAGDVTSLLSSILEFYTDAKFVVPHFQQLMLLALSPEPLYAYIFDQSTIRLLRNNFNISGALHGSELVYLFGPSYSINLNEKRLSGPEETFSKLMKKYFTDFARKGQPVVDHYGHNLPWKRATPVEVNNFLLTYEQPQVCLPVSKQTELQESTYSLWMDLFNRLQNITTLCKRNASESATTGFQIISDASRPFRSAMYTLICFVTALLVLLVICLVLLKKRSKERERDIF